MKVIYCFLCLLTSIFASPIERRDLSTKSEFTHEYHFDGGIGKNFSLLLKLENSLIGNLENGKDCVFTGFDLNAHRNSSVLANFCLNETFVVIHRSRKEWLIPSNLTLQEINDTEINKACGETHSDFKETSDSFQNLTVEEAKILYPLQKRRYVRVNVITDKAFAAYHQYNYKDIEKATLNIISYSAFLYSTMPGSYNISLQVASIYHLQKQSAPWDDLYEASSILQAFAVWSQPRRKQTNEALHLLTGIDLLGSTIGIARIRGYCVGSGFGLTQATYSDAGNGKIMTHEVGHNLGIQHTNVYSTGTANGSPEAVKPCSEILQSIMSPFIYGTSGIWDQCSVNWFRMQQEGYPYGCSGEACVYKPSSPSCYDSSVKNTCGNGIVEAGEECDTDDHCCVNCKLKGVCTPSESKCCNRFCQFKRRGKLCHRREHRLCDSAARCTGNSKDCPLSRALNTGKTCAVNGVLGNCSNRQCLSHEIQCKEMATLFPSKNVKGSCPRANGGDIGCGKLYCLYGSYGYCDSFSVNGATVYVKDGTPCSVGLVCRNGKCTN